MRVLICGDVGAGAGAGGGGGGGGGGGECRRSAGILVCGASM